LRRRLIVLGYLTLCAFLITHLINTLVAAALAVPVETLPVHSGPTAQASGPKLDLVRTAEDILSSGVFAVEKGGNDMAGLDATAPGASGGPAGPPIDAAKKVKLIGTVVGEGLDPFAVIEDVMSKRQALYHLLEVIPNVGALAEIRTDAVLIQQGNQRELLELNTGQVQVASAPRLGSGPSRLAMPSSLRRVLDQREVTQTMADLPRLLSDARAVPVYTNGKVDGWRIEGITPQSFFEKIGLRAGDVLQRVNGVEIRDPGMILSLFQQVQNERSVKLDMVRGGQKITVDYEIR
jgi:general secretion pathway protein C